MKVIEAEKKVCPFLSDFESVGTVAVSIPKKCITKDCMAWISTKEYLKKAHKEIGYYQYHRKDLEDGEKEGYCQRIGNAK